MACNYGLLWLIYGLLRGVVACHFVLLGFPARYSMGQEKTESFGMEVAGLRDSRLHRPNIPYEGRCRVPHSRIWASFGVSRLPSPPPSRPTPLRAFMKRRQLRVTGLGMLWEFRRGL